MNRQVAQCNCAKRFQVEQISANRYRVSAEARHQPGVPACSDTWMDSFPSICLLAPLPAPCRARAVPLYRDREGTQPHYPEEPWPLGKGSTWGAGGATGRGRSGCCHLLQTPLPNAQPCPSPCQTPTSLSLQFGESQQLRMVRILRSTLMVRVGGGWIALDEFLVKNDPCRGGCGGPIPGTGPGTGPCGSVGPRGAQITKLPRVCQALTLPLAASVVRSEGKDQPEDQ